ncbi:type IV secretion protein Rhs [Vibrio cholerae]|nr:type IV secretion protein Rhs [Vibrio cholerae]
MATLAYSIEVEGLEDETLVVRGLSAITTPSTNLL